jgi:hypothetical protein
LNYEFTQVGGCQQEVAAGDNILWAYDAFDKEYFLKMTSNAPTAARVGDTATFAVTDGTTGVVIPNAAVAVVGGGESGTTDANGVVTITFATSGTKRFKAERSDSLRSNAIVVTVSA